MIYDEKIVNYIIARIKDVWKLNSDFEKLGSGAYGIAYTNPDRPNIVFKITADKSEVYSAKYAMRHSNKYLCKTYKIYRFTSSKSNLVHNYWLIEKELVEPLTGNESKIIGELYFYINYNDLIQKRVDSDYFETRVLPNKRFQDDIQKMGVPFKTVKEITKKFTNLISNIQKYNLSTDYHNENIGYRIGNHSHYVFFDYGGIYFEDDIDLKIKRSIKVENKII